MFVAILTLVAALLSCKRFHQIRFVVPNYETQFADLNYQHQFVTIHAPTIELAICKFIGAPMLRQNRHAHLNREALT